METSIDNNIFDRVAPYEMYSKVKNVNNEKVPDCSPSLSISLRKVQKNNIIEMEESFNLNSGELF